MLGLGRDCLLLMPFPPALMLSAAGFAWLLGCPTGLFTAAPVPFDTIRNAFSMVQETHFWLETSGLVRFDIELKRCTSLLILRLRCLGLSQAFRQGFA
jgi:hypothetical protein